MQIFLRIKNYEELQEISLTALPFENTRKGKFSDLLWESTGEYFLEAFQCGADPLICSIEKDPRILNKKEEIALLIVDELKKEKGLQVSER